MLHMPYLFIDDVHMALGQEPVDIVESPGPFFVPWVRSHMSLGFLE